MAAVTCKYRTFKMVIWGRCFVPLGPATVGHLSNRRTNRYLLSKTLKLWEIGSHDLYEPTPPPPLQSMIKKANTSFSKFSKGTDLTISMPPYIQQLVAIVRQLFCQATLFFQSIFNIHESLLEKVSLQMISEPSCCVSSFLQVHKRAAMDNISIVAINVVHQWRHILVLSLSILPHLSNTPCWAVKKNQAT